MKLSTCSQVLSAASLAAAAPHLSPRDAGIAVAESVPFPTTGLPHVLSPEEITVLMSDDKAEQIREELAAAGASSSSSTPASDFSESSFVTRAAAAASCKTNVRVEWNRMTSANKKSFVDAIVCLTKKPSRGVAPGPDGAADTGGRISTLWDDLYWTHSFQYRSVHSTDNFLPFHRYFVHVFEKLLRSECGYKAPLPWWRETDAAGKVKASNLFTKDYFGTLPDRNANGGFCISDGVSGKLLTSFSLHSPFLPISENPKSQD